MQQADNLDGAALAAARRHMGEFAWPTVIFGGGVILSYVTTLALTAGGNLPLLVAMPLVAVLTYMTYTVLHESVHGSISGGSISLRWLNEALGYMAAWILMTPLTAHRHVHLAHHRSTNREEDDPDFVVSKMLKSPWTMARLAPQVMWKQYDYYLRNRWGRGRRSQDLVLCLEVSAIVAPRLAFCAAGFWLEGLAVFLVAWLVGIMLLLYLFAYLVHSPHRAVGRYVDTSTFLVKGPLGKIVTWLWLFQNYHSIHHLFPRVPFYRYPSVFGDIEEIMVARGAPVYHLGVDGLRARDRLPA